MTAMIKRPTSRARPPTTSSASAPTSRSCSARSTASRWSISTTAPRRRSRARCSRPSSTPTRWNTPTSIAGCIISPTRPPPSYEDARETVRRFLNAPSVEEIIFTRNATEGINLVASSFGAWTSGEGDEIVLSIMEHHSNIVPWHFQRERKGAVLKWAPIADDGDVPARRVRAAADQAHQDGRDHAHVERAGHRRADQGGRAHRARARHPGAGRRQPGRGAHAASTCRISTATSTSSPGTRSMGPTGHRRALRQEEAPRRHAALSWAAAR